MNAKELAANTALTEFVRADLNVPQDNATVSRGQGLLTVKTVASSGNAVASVIARGTKKNPANALGSHLKGALVKMSHRRALFVMCSGMHTTAAQDILKKVCSGKLRGPGL